VTRCALVLLTLSACGPVASSHDAALDAPPEDVQLRLCPGFPVCHEEDAATDADAASCVTDLSDVGTGDFLIAFTLTTTALGLTIPIVSQRAGCGSPFWDVSLRPNGIVVAATDSSFVEASSPVNDGTPHHIIITRASGQLSYSDNGTTQPPIADTVALGSLPPLVIGTSDCAGATPLAGHGTLTDLCITR